MLIFIALWNELKPVTVYEAEKMHPSIFTHMGKSRGSQRSKAEKSGGLTLQMSAEVLVDFSSLHFTAEHNLCEELGQNQTSTLAEQDASPVVVPFHLKPCMSHSNLFVTMILYSLTPVPRMIMTIVMSYQCWHYTGFTAWRFTFNIIIGHLLFCLHCFEGFMSSRLAVQRSGAGGLCQFQNSQNKWRWKQLSWG